MNFALPPPWRHQGRDGITGIASPKGRSGDSMAALGNDSVARKSGRIDKMGIIAEFPGAVRARNRSLTDSANRIRCTGSRFQDGPLRFPLARDAHAPPDPAIRAPAIPGRACSDESPPCRPRSTGFGTASRRPAARSPGTEAIPDSTLPRIQAGPNRATALPPSPKGRSASMGAILMAAWIGPPATDCTISALSRHFMSGTTIRSGKPGQIAEKVATR